MRHRQPYEGRLTEVSMLREQSWWNVCSIYLTVHLEIEKVPLAKKDCIGLDLSTL